MKDKSLCALLLLAGESKRFKQANKLLAEINHIPICAHTLKNLLNSTIERILVVTGHEHKRVMSALENHVDLDTDRIHLIYNDLYNSGMGSSIATGLRHASGFDAAMICLGDMPYIKAEVIEKLRIAWERDNQSLAFVPEFNKRVGNPVILRQYFFSKLMSSTEDMGAKELLKEYDKNVCKVPVTSDAIFRDIDTISDLPTH